MIAEKLRKAVIMAAMQGKLTQQSIVDGDSNDYFDKSFFVKENEQLFDIPGNWAWFRLGSILTTVMGQSPKSESVNSSSGLEFHQGKVAFTEFLISHSGKYCTNPTKIASKNSVLLCVRAPVGIVNYTDRELCIGRGLVSVEGNDKVDVLYIYRYLETMKEYYEKKSTGSTFKAITSKVINNTPFALPPLAEQKRIVEKLDEILPLIDSLEKDELKLKELMQQFPDSMKTSVLKAAIQGNLTERHFDDDNPKELFSKHISNVDYEFPFDVPENWIWVDFDTVIKSLGTKKHQVLASEVKKEGKYPVVSQSQKFIDGYSDYSDKLIRVNKPIIIFGDHTKSIKLIDFDFIVGADGTKLLRVNNSNTKFIYYVLMYYISTLETRNYGRHFKLLSSNLIPIPSLAEQSRIVDKLDGLLPNIENINNE